MPPTFPFHICFFFVQHYTDQGLLILLPYTTEQSFFFFLTLQVPSPLKSAPPPLLTNVAQSVWLSWSKHNAVFDSAETTPQQPTQTLQPTGRPEVYCNYTAWELPPRATIPLLARRQNGVQTPHSMGGTHSEKRPTRATGDTGHSEMGDRDSCWGGSRRQF